MLLQGMGQYLNEVLTASFKVEEKASFPRVVGRAGVQSTRLKLLFALWVLAEGELVITAEFCCLK